MIGDYLDVYTYDAILTSALGRVSSTLDKRQGSVIYDALAPACAELAQAYIEMKSVLLETYAMTATGEYLDNRVAEAGLTRYPATYATKLAVFKDGSDAAFIVSLNSRFSIASDTTNLSYVATAYSLNGQNVIPGSYVMTCEQAGTQGNAYTGSLIPITYINGLATAVMSTLLTAARDAETDDELRARYIYAINEKAFGGNITDYDREIKEITGVGEVQVYPIWNGGGTVKCSIIDSAYVRLGSQAITDIQTIIDPTGNQGIGLGTAPIGHTVTIVTPTNKTLNITADVTLGAGVIVGQVQTPVEAAVETYILGLRHNWGIGSVLNVYALKAYISQVSAAILGVTGVVNVANVKINASGSDLTLTQNSTTQELPVKGTVTLNVV